MENENVRRDDTKGKIMLFVIGVLLGAVIASAAFLISVNTLGINNGGGSSAQMPGGGGTPPEMPSGDKSQSGQSQQGTPPEMPSNNSQSSSNQSSESQ